MIIKYIIKTTSSFYARAGAKAYKSNVIRLNLYKNKYIRVHIKIKRRV